jgi:dUTP pyrophosphatase
MAMYPTFLFALREDLELAGETRFLPTQADPEATGYDVRAAQNITIKPGEYFKIPLGFRCFCPPEWYYQLHPRSSSFTKKSMHNLVGIVDELWEGETLFAGQYILDKCSMGKDLVIEFGTPIGQIIPMRREIVQMKLGTNKELDELFKKRNGIRGTGGFGSTGG